MAEYEGSKEDRMRDRREARKRKMSLREWEASPEDAAEDAKHMKAGGGVRGMGAAKRGGKYTVR